MSAFSGSFDFITTSDWSQFVPDLIIGVFTGIAVGVVLAYFGKRSRKHNERSEARLELWALEGELRVALAYGIRYELSTPASPPELSPTVGSRATIERMIECLERLQPSDIGALIEVDFLYPMIEYFNEMARRSDEIERLALEMMRRSFPGNRAMVEHEIELLRDAIHAASSETGLSPDHVKSVHMRHALESDVRIAAEVGAYLGARRTAELAVRGYVECSESRRESSHVLSILGAQASTGSERVRRRAVAGRRRQEEVRLEQLKTDSWMRMQETFGGC